HTASGGSNSIVESRRCVCIHISRLPFHVAQVHVPVIVLAFHLALQLIVCVPRILGIGQRGGPSQTHDGMIWFIQTLH
ncbi:MAG: hypothetical protein ABI955_04555, partial [Nitrospirota bacterium]